MTDRPSPRSSIVPPASAAPVRIALVGHCGPDSWMLKGVAQRAFPGGEVVMVDSDTAARAEAARADLLLINRQLDGDFQAGSGLDLIGALVPMQGRRAAVMLVSNFTEAQAQARALGASRGFGKAKAGSDDAAAAMREAVARAQGCGREARGGRAGMTGGEEPARSGGGNSGPDGAAGTTRGKSRTLTGRPNRDGVVE